MDSRSVQLGGDAYAPSRKCLGLDLVSGSWRPRAPLTYEGRGRDTQLVRGGDTVLAVGGTKNGNTEAAPCNRHWVSSLQSDLLQDYP